MYDYSDQCVLFADKFTGKERDSESGLDNFGARYDSSQYGRFMTPDPVMFNELRLINPQRLILYSYSVNNPITYADPDGRDVRLQNPTRANGLASRTLPLYLSKKAQRRASGMRRVTLRVRLLPEARPKALAGCHASLLEDDGAAAPGWGMTRHP